MAPKLSINSTTKIGALFVVFLLGSWITSCIGGPGGSDGSCDVNDDCDSGYYCRGPNHPNACGVPPREACVWDADCAIGLTCHTINDSCSPDGFGSECTTPCTTATCGAEFRCNAGGACEPIACDEGFACPSWQRCDPMVAHATGPMHARTHGCVNIVCTNDKVCPAGKSCVTGFCQEGPGSCTEDIAVP